MITFIIILLVPYIASAYYNFKMIQLEYYHPKGRMYGCRTDLEEILRCFFPLVNFAHSYFFLIEGWSDKPEIKKSSTLFKPKKPFKDV